MHVGNVRLSRSKCSEFMCSDLRVYGNMHIVKARAIMLRITGKI